MQFKITVSALALAAAVSALQITAPAENSSLDFSKKNVISWTSVNTDPSSFDIYLVDMTVNPSISKLIASNVQTSAGSYTINSLDVPTGNGYQINFDSDTPQNSGILAQSGQFAIVKAGAPTTSASFTGTTGTATASIGSSSASAASSSGSASASASASATGSSGSTSGTSSPSTSGSSTASGANASGTGNAASKMTISGGLTGLVLGALALLM